MNSSEDKIAEIKNSLRLRMNGIAAKAMKDNCQRYRLVYGVPMHELREIAASHEKDSSIAEKLWASGVREEMLIATMMIPNDKMSEDHIKRYAQESPSLEVLMELSRNIDAARMNDDTLLTWADGNDENTAGLSMLAAAKRINLMDDAHTEAMLSKSISLGEKPSYILAKSCAEFIKGCIHEKKTKNPEIEDKIKHLSQSENKTSRLLYEEIMTEIKYG